VEKEESFRNGQQGKVKLPLKAYGELGYRYTILDLSTT
jgi:hypothetical protein